MGKKTRQKKETKGAKEEQSQQESHSEPQVLIETKDGVKSFLSKDGDQGAAGYNITMYGHSAYNENLNEGRDENHRRYSNPKPCNLKPKA